MNSDTIIILAVYFLPTLIAGLRSHANGVPILLVNLLLGWTGIGWFIALIWSFTHQRQPQMPQIIYQEAPPIPRRMTIPKQN